MRGYNASPVPPRRADVLWIESIKGGEKQKFTVYSPCIQGVYTHWTGHSTKPCYEDHTFCEGGHSEETMRWKGYLHCWSYKRSRNVFVQLTEEACRNFLQQLAEGSSLRGVTIEVSRTASNKGRIHVNVLTWMQQKTVDLPPPLDARKSLEHLWKVKPIEELLNASLVTCPEEVPQLLKMG